MRTLTAILHPLPISNTELQLVENNLKNCSRRLKQFENTNETTPSKPSGNDQDDYDDKLPLVTRQLFVDCHEVWKLLNKTGTDKYPHELVGEDDLAFKMIGNNVTEVLHQLDWVRKNRRKFVCINDDIDHSRDDAMQVRRVLMDFYESMFPLPSQFELKPNLRNRFLYKHELDEWMSESRLLSQEVHYLVISLVVLLLLFLLRNKVFLCCRVVFKLFFLRGRRFPDDLDI